MGWLSEAIAEARHGITNGAVIMVNLLLLFLGWQHSTPITWHLAWIAVTASSALAWLLNHTRYRLVADTPTSRVVSAPQGYAEFAGQGRLMAGDQLFSHLSGVPCLWYRYRIERETNDNTWERVSSGSSHDTFMLDDGSGQLLIDPDGAEIRTPHKREWLEDGYRKTEWLLRPNEPLYGIGEHVTLGGANAELDEKQDISALLTQWKKDPARLLSHFDSNQDGTLDAREWAAAVLQAKRDIAAEHHEIRLRDGVHLLRKPRDGRLFLVASEPPEQLAQRYRRWGWAHLAFIPLASFLLIRL